MAYARHPHGRGHIDPNSRQLPQSHGIPTSKLSDDDLKRLGADDLIRRLRICESEKMQAIVDRGNVMKDVNQRMQTLLAEMRNLKEVNKKLQDESQELRDLCCFLDDDRQKGRKLAKEWQRFGRYTSSVMKSEVATYQEKLKQLEKQQGELIKENLSLKELCIYLDEDVKRLRRGASSYDRDQGDGSSSSSAGDKPEEPSPTAELGMPRPVLTEQTLQYIRRMEDQIDRLEEEKKHLAQRVDRNGAEGETSDRGRFFSSPQLREPVGHSENSSASSSNKPAAVAHAMAVLEVHEQLERPASEVVQDTHANVMADEEKALLRQMCNVVWKKLGAEAPGYDSRY